MIRDGFSSGGAIARTADAAMDHGTTLVRQGEPIMVEFLVRKLWYIVGDRSWSEGTACTPPLESTNPIRQWRILITNIIIVVLQKTAIRGGRSLTIPVFGSAYPTHKYS